MEGNRINRKPCYIKLCQLLESIGGDVFCEAANEFLTDHQKVYRLHLAAASRGDAPDFQLSGHQPKQALEGNKPKNVFSSPKKIAYRHRENDEGRTQKTLPEEKAVVTLFKPKHGLRPPGSGKDAVPMRCNDPNEMPDQNELAGKRLCEAKTLAASSKVSMASDRGKFPKFTDTIPPFVAGTSISTSHNIFLTFQEVLSILKRKSARAANELRSRGCSGEKTTEGYCKSQDEQTVPFAGGMVVETKTSSFDFNKDAMISRFKAVLRNLYDDFTTMSQEYEQVVQSFSTQELKCNPKKKQLRKLDKILANKEEEIIVLISLYRELIKSQEKAREEQRDIKANPSRIDQRLRFSESTNVRLKYLLKQVRKFQQQLNQ